jgi:hypothetical protein
MSDDKNPDIRAIADSVIEMEEELEVSGNVAIEDAVLRRAKAKLHVWIDEAVGVVMTPALGRTTIIHANGRRSTISSPDLAMLLSLPD